MNTKYIKFIGIIGLIFNSVHATTIELTIDDFIKESIKRNSNVIMDRLQGEIVDNKVKYEEDIFVPQFYSKFNYQKTDVPTNIEDSLTRGNDDPYQDRIRNIEMGFTGLLNTGGVWKTSFSNNKKTSSLILNSPGIDYDNEYTNVFEVSLTQPLLKGAGKEVTLAKYSNALADKEINNKEYEKLILDLSLTVVQTYWKFYGIKELKNSYIESIKLNKQSIQTLENRVTSGDAPVSEVLEAKSNLMIKEAELKRIESDFIQIKSNIFNLLNVHENENKDIVFKLMDKPINIENIDNTPESLFDKALVNWPEYKIAKAKLKKESINYDITKNSLLPQLDLSASIFNTDLKDHQNNDFDTSNFVSGSFGLDFKMPITSSQSQKALEIARLKKLKVDIEINTLEKRLYNAISAKLTSYLNAKEQVQFYKKSLELREQILKDKEISFNLGDINIKEVFEQINFIIDYKRKLFSSIIEWKMAEASLQKTTGELLANDLNIEKLKSYQGERYDNSLNNTDFGVLND